MSMSLRKPVRFLLPTVLIVGGFVAACFLWVRAEQHQYALNRDLIDALVKSDENRAIYLVNAGADPNTPYSPPPRPTLNDLWNSLLHHTRPSAEDCPTALQLACGANYENEVQAFQQDVSRLVDAMLRHGGNAHVLDGYHSTLLMIAATDTDRTPTVELLLQHGANVNAHSDYDDTALMAACSPPFSPKSVRVLLAHGARVDDQNVTGQTALYMVLPGRPSKESTDIVRQLLEHGASPNLPDHMGVTALERAKRNHLTEIVALMEHHNTPDIKGSGRNGIQ